MCGKIFLMAVFVAAFLIHSARSIDAQVQRWCRISGADYSTAPDVLSLEKPEGFWEAPCHDEECRAIKDIDCSVTAQAHRLLPNTMGYGNPLAAQHAFAVYGDNIRALGIEHPERIPLYCKLLARVAATLTGEWPKDSMTGAGISDLALRLERPGQSSCIGQLAAATLPTPKAQKTMRWVLQCRHHVRACQACLDPPMLGASRCKIQALPPGLF